MDALQQAVLHNNNAVRLLNHGDSCGAIQSLQQGFAAMEKIAHLFSSVDDLFDVSILNQVFDTNKCQSALHMEQSTGVKLDGLQHNLCFVYDRPLLIQPQAVDAGLLVPTALILFNLGLAWHQRGRLSGSEASLQHASMYYDLTFRLIPCSRSHHGDDMLGVVKCLALNNLAHLFYEGCKYQESQACMERLDNLIVWTGCLEGSSASLFLSTSDCDEIKLNLFHLVPPNTANAA